jgi:CubicO group peptidase (beta-lactamase class C family)
MNLSSAAAVAIPATILSFLTIVATPARGDSEFDNQKLGDIAKQMQPFIDRKEIAGAVTLVATPEKVVRIDAVGAADIASNRPMAADNLFWIASMTKPITGVAIMTLVEEGKLSFDDPASKYLPELGRMKMKDGSPAKTITVRHLMTHSAGLPENTPDETKAAKNLQDLVTAFATKPMQFEPGSKWQYCQTGINSLGRIIEVVSGKHYQDYLDEKIFKPLGMTDTTFYPSAELQKRIATSYKAENGQLTPTVVSLFAGKDLADHNRVPLANGGLYSTAGDYGKFARMLLNEGTLDGKQVLKPESVKQLRTVHSGDLVTGFTPGNGWGCCVCVVRQPQGVSEALSPGSFGHGGAYGTQAWIDPVKKVAYVLMVQRSNFPNSDASDVRKAFQNAAAGAMKN